MLKKAVQQGPRKRSPRNVHQVREEAERLRTPLVAFFSILLEEIVMAEDDKTEDKITGTVTIEREADQEPLATTVTVGGDAATVLRQAAAGPTTVKLDRSVTRQTEDQPLWTAIRNRTQAIGFNRYNDFIWRVLCESPTEPERPSYASPEGSTRDTFGSPPFQQRRVNLANRPTIYGMDAYNLLKLATEAFLIFECGLVDKDGGVILDPQLFKDLEEERRLGRPTDIEAIKEELKTYLGADNPRVLPYLDRIVKQIVSLDLSRREEALPYCEKMLQHRLTCFSLLELIWSYWHEEGMLVQTMSAITLRFQNKRLHARDPLANLELDPLRPLNNLIWGFIQDEYNRLSVQRRAYEYDHHYGFVLVGKAVPQIESADSRSKFVGAFHNLLYRTAMFYREDDDTTVIADAFTLLNALREVHLILAEGAQNQFGDLPWTARREMLIMQWLLARPETKEFLRGRYMVPYQEPWMGAVDDMKRLQGWSDVTETHFHELAVYGEQILLAIRYGDWIDVNDQEQARNWARYWRPEIQRYIHAYHAVTGVDLAADIVDTRRAEDRYLQPSVHLKNRLAQRSRGALPASTATNALSTYEMIDSPPPRSRSTRYRGEE
jgi:hypothetical protein